MFLNRHGFGKYSATSMTIQATNSIVKNISSVPFTGLGLRTFSQTMKPVVVGTIKDFKVFSPQDPPGSYENNISADKHGDCEDEHDNKIHSLLSRIKLGKYTSNQI